MPVRSPFLSNCCLLVDGRPTRKRALLPSPVGPSAPATDLSLAALSATAHTVNDRGRHSELCARKSSRGLRKNNGVCVLTTPSYSNTSCSYEDGQTLTITPCIPTYISPAGIATSHQKFDVYLPSRNQGSRLLSPLKLRQKGRSNGHIQKVSRQGVRSRFILGRCMGDPIPSQPPDSCFGGVLCQCGS
jgi:hypothetical protein